jgi:hypothetical protein
MDVSIGLFRALVNQTVREALRQPVILLTTTVAILFAALMPLMTAFQFWEGERLIRDGILALHFTLGAYLAATVSQLVMGVDLQGRAAGLLLCKPVPRWTFFLARYTGSLVVLVLFTLGLWVAAVLSVRIGPTDYVVDEKAGLGVLLAVGAAHAISAGLNYRRGTPYAEWAFFLTPAALLLVLGGLALRDGRSGLVPVSMIGSVGARMAPAFALIFLGLAVITAAAHALLARVAGVPWLTGGVIVLIVAGLSLEPLLTSLGRGVSEHLLGKALIRLVPSWSLFWPADALEGGRSLPLAYVGWVTLYAAAWSAFFLAVGAVSFERREVG